METTPQTVRETLAKLRELPPLSVERRLAALEKFWQCWQPTRSREIAALAGRSWAQLLRGLGALAASAPHCSEPAELGKPGVLALILAGNTPLLAWPALHYCVLLGIPVFIKQSRDETIWTRLFVETLAEIDPEVAAYLHLDYFPGVMDERMISLLVGADATIAYGSDKTLQSLWRVAWKKPFLPFGHATSLGFWAADCWEEDWDRALMGFAYDILMYGQQGCLSPHTIYVEAGGHTTITLAHELAEALSFVNEQMAIPLVTDPAIAQRVREAADMARFEGKYVIQDEGLAWTVIYATTGEILTPGVGHGVIRLVPSTFRFFQNWPFLLGDLRGKISSVGVAGALTDEQRGALEAEGVSRICRAGQMQTPPLDWRNGGVDLRAWLAKSLAS